MSKTFSQRLFTSLVDTLHHWSGTLLAPESAKKETPGHDTSVAPVQNGIHFVRQAMVALTVFMDPALFDELTQLAKAMQISEQDVLLRLTKLATMIRVYGLYGVPTREGNTLSIHVLSTGEAHRINMECPAQGNHKPPTPPAPKTPPPYTN